MEPRLGVLIPLPLVRLVDARGLAARFEGAEAAKTVPRGADRPTTWRRVLRLLEAPAQTVEALEKLPARSVRAAKLRLFRAFKLLGGLKRAASVAAAPGRRASRSAARPAAPPA
jgi:hypothetical protein